MLKVSEPLWENFNNSLIFKVKNYVYRKQI